ncbi:hypothetical protein PE074_06370 [Wohlfahrtiimonas chitiniclastica]|uniref:hypothetical protein n=1 Tax=Wohlfahrtiimonas chitiniclastica TaxID=400946 RepID=UPI0007B40C2E|nr:hypothetical protein [Wohlfahrtiimonas chitiniclastica]MBS7826482.1 hypothetical protein [Wohlfahrtiimonas chitiniclastica]WHR54722.1 hypothetical protein PE074_06370 [Wohlfahrtiimonas chitiniclastica]
MGCLIQINQLLAKYHTLLSIAEAEKERSMQLQKSDPFQEIDVFYWRGQALAITHFITDLEALKNKIH